MSPEKKLFPCFRIKCVTGKEFCHTKAKLCLPCSKYTSDCFTERHKQNCTTFCTKLFVRDQNGSNQSTGALDEVWIWCLIALFVLIIAVPVVLRLLPIVHREIINLTQRVIRWQKSLVINSPTNTPNTDQDFVDGNSVEKRYNVPLLPTLDSHTVELTPGSISESGNNCNPDIIDVNLNVAQEQGIPDVKVMSPSAHEVCSFDACPS